MFPSGRPNPIEWYRGNSPLTTNDDIITYADGLVVSPEGVHMKVSGAIPHMDDLILSSSGLGRSHKHTTCTDDVERLTYSM